MTGAGVGAFVATDVFDEAFIYLDALPMPVTYGYKLFNPSLT